MKTVQAIGVGFGLAVGFAAAVVGFIMFGAAAMTSSEAKPDVPAAPPPEPPPPPEPLAQTAAEPATPAPKLHTLTLAVFRDDVLSECVDYTIALPPEAEAKAEAAVEKLAKQMLGDSKPGENQIRLQKSCDAQFAGRTVLGACNATIDLSARMKDARLIVNSRQYDTRLVGDNDVAMKDCLEMGGDWTANPEAVEQAQLEQRVKQRAKQIERLTGSN